MDIKFKKDINDMLTVKATGKIDIETAVEYGTKISDAIDDEGIKYLALDFSEITYISSMGLRVILELHQKMSNLGSMKLINVSNEVLNIFKMTGFSKFLNIV